MIKIYFQLYSNIYDLIVNKFLRIKISENIHLTYNEDKREYKLKFFLGKIGRIKYFWKKETEFNKKSDTT